MGGVQKFVVFVLAFLLAQFAAAGKSKPELTPSCLDASKVQWFRAKGEHSINKALVKLDKAREETGVALRNINWDGAAVLNLIEDEKQGEVPGDLFLNGAGFRQILFTEPLIASNESFKSVFNGSEHGDDVGADPFTLPINVAPLTSNEVTVSFALEDRVTAAMVNGFGVIFNDVEQKNSAGLSFYDSAGKRISSVWAKKGGNGNQQLVAGVFDETVVASVVIHLGNNGNIDLSKKEGKKGNDFVAMDDWFFFLADTEVPTVTYRGEVEERDDEILEIFDNRRVALDQSQVQNINWDGAAVTSLTNSARAMLDREIFLNGAGFRQLTIALQSEQPFASEDEFSLAANNFGLGSFTGTVNFAPYANTLTIDFFLEDRVTTGLIHGFGVIFTDVELPQKSGLRAYDANGNLIANVRARPQESGTHQFIGVIFARPVIAQIVLDMGDDVNLPNPAEDLANGIDLVAVDDWLFFKAVTAA